MRLIQWLDGGRWSGAHISHIGEPLCAAPMPEKPQATRERRALVRDWRQICPDCKAVALKAATGTEPIEVLTLIGR